VGIKKITHFFIGQTHIFQLHEDFIVERRLQLLVRKNDTISNDNLILN
jgi:hypothetical protein